MKILNPSIKIIDSAKADEFVIKLDNSGNLLKLSSLELNIIKDYSDNNCKETLITNYKMKFIEIDSKDLDNLLKIAEDNKILIDTDLKTKEYFGVKIRPVFRRNFKMFELFNLDFSNTIFEKFFEDRKVLRFILITIPVTFLYFILSTFINAPNFKSDYLETIRAVPVSFTSIIIFIYFGSFLTVCFHELGHYIAYKIVKGKSSILGFGLLYCILPSAYCKVYYTLINRRKDRILVYISGIIFDIFLVSSFFYFTKYWHNQYPTTSFILYCMIISISIRSFFNLNFFLPGTDGYFILTDLTNKPDLLSDSKYIFIKALRFNILWSIRIIPYIFYYIASVIFTIISFAILFIPLYFYFIS